MDKILPQIVDVVSEVLRPIRCSLMLIYDNGELRIKAGKNICVTVVRGLRLKPGEGVAGRALETGLPVMVRDVSTSEYYYKLFSPEVKPLRKEALIAVPLKFQDKNYGVLNLHFKIIKKFPRSRFEGLILSIIAEQTSAAIHRCYTFYAVVSDSMTKLYNHDYIIKRLQEEIVLANKFNTKLSLVMFDIDHFKQINDKYGHQVGDLVITTISEVIRDNVRITDIAGRYGGEEFCLILPHTSLRQAVIVAERLRQEVCSRKFFTSNGEITVTCSFGVKEFSGETFDELISKTDELLYRAKSLGRNRVCY
ncbi:MAG: sensor domain-containing diguanylate cyclase [Endomicrobia bacterium]|nr:sensor domain-containing diguanylate cyclase [Endomicrobiia bacterium]MDW8055670.1 sensor domain-containing diguanylate cyclase [Elusimicrobiota bacterium]